MRTVRTAVRRRVGWSGFLAVAVLIMTSCGVGDRANFENEADRLRAEVQRIVDDTTKELSANGDQTVQTVQQQLEKHVPGPPSGQLLKLGGSAESGRARVGFAVDGKIDGYGPGGTTVTLRMCVVVTMAPPPDLNTTIEDTDCSTLIPKTDSIVRFRT